MAQKFLVGIDLSKNELQNARIQNLGSAPGTPVEGQLYYDTTTDSPFVYSAETSTWIPLFANKLSAAIPNSALVNSSVTIGTSSVALGATTLSLAGLTGLALASGNFSQAGSGTFSTGTGAITLNGAVTISGTNAFTTGTGAITLNGDVTVAAGKTLTLAADPSSNLHAATKQYVDNMASGLDAKASVKYATTAALAISTRTSTTLTTALTTWSPDGAAVTNGDRVLVKDSTTGTGSGTHDNGIYTVSGVGTAIVLTRATDADTWLELPSAYVWVEEGTTNADTGWNCTSNAGGTLGTTPVSWVLFSSASALIAGDGLTKSGNTINVASAAGSAGTVGTLTITADTVGVALGSTSTTAAPGNHTHANMALTTGTLAQFAATTSDELRGVISNETGTGALVFGTSPTLTTPVLGVATATSINKVAITAPATSSTLTIADGKTLTASNTLTLTGTDGSSVAFGAGGTVAYTSNNLSVFASTTSAQLAGVISDETGSGALVFGTSPTFTTPIISPVVYGASTASGTLLLSSTSNATKGTITLGDSNAGTLTVQAATMNILVGAAASSGFLKVAATTGLVSIDTNTYLTAQSNDFGVISIDNTDTEYTWVTTDNTTTTADTTADTLKIVAAKTNATHGIQVRVDAANDAIGIAHADTSSQASVDNSANQQFLKSITFDEFGHVTAITSATPAGSVAKYAVSIGDGSNTSYTVTHNLGTTDVTVEVFEVASPYARVFTDVEHTSTNTITVKFATAPTTNQYRVVVMG